MNIRTRFIEYLRTVQRLAKDDDWRELFWICGFTGFPGFCLVVFAPSIEEKATGILYLVMIFFMLVGMPAILRLKYKNVEAIPVETKDFSWWRAQNIIPFAIRIFVIASALAWWGYGVPNLEAKEVAGQIFLIVWGTVGIALTIAFITVSLVKKILWELAFRDMMSAPMHEDYK